MTRLRINISKASGPWDGGGEEVTCGEEQDVTEQGGKHGEWKMKEVGCWEGGQP